MTSITFLLTKISCLTHYILAFISCGDFYIVNNQMLVWSVGYFVLVGLSQSLNIPLLSCYILLTFGL